MARILDERQDSINAELKAAERRINAALKASSERLGLTYEPIPTEAQNAPDLIWLQKAQHVANALEALDASADTNINAYRKPTLTAAEPTDAETSKPSRKGL